MKSIDPEQPVGPASPMILRVTFAPPRFGGVLVHVDLIVVANPAEWAARPEASEKDWGVITPGYAPYVIAARMTA
jgi:hypothetical protein